MPTDSLDPERLKKNLDEIEKLAKTVIASIDTMLPKNSDKIETLKTVLPTVSYLIIQICLKYGLDVYTFISYVITNIKTTHKMLNVMHTTPKHLLN